LLYGAFGKALERERRLLITKSRGYVAAVNPSQVNDLLLINLKKATGGLVGRIPSTEVEWREGIRFQFDYRLNKLWLLIEPTLAVECDEDSPDFDASREFIRKKKAERYNSKWNELLSAWSDILGAGSRSVQLSAFGIEDGVVLRSHSSRKTPLVSEHDYRTHSASARSRRHFRTVAEISSRTRLGSPYASTGRSG
jgi:hypothetical protein